VGTYQAIRPRRVPPDGKPMERDTISGPNARAVLAGFFTCDFQRKHTAINRSAGRSSSMSQTRRL
jgi:hypothetical protein